MSYLDHIKKCNTFTPKRYLAFLVDGEQMGWMQKAFSEQLLRWDDVFRQTVDATGRDAVSVNPALDNAQARTRACHAVVEVLHTERVIKSWVGERYAVTHTFGETPRMLIERAAVSYFGVRGYGVHINGLVKKADGIHVWCARRARDKPSWPGFLDQIVAGGQPAGIGLMENVIKESAEEANIPADLAGQAELVSTLHYRAQTERGAHVDTLFNYDLWLPEDFVPENTDGEVDEFLLMPIEQMAQITETTNDFKGNCNLVNIDLLVRLGLIDVQHPQYAQIRQTLYAPALLV